MIAPAHSPPKFQPGQLVRHVRYRYRGVVVDVDFFCRAPESWYQANRTRPDREQPWYHVLVHGGGNITYAAQTSLTGDPTLEPVDHPLIDMYFDGFDGQAYNRNQRPWSGW